MGMKTGLEALADFVRAALDRVKPDGSDFAMPVEIVGGGGASQVEGAEAAGDGATANPIVIGGVDFDAAVQRLKMDGDGAARVSLYGMNAMEGDTPFRVDSFDDGDAQPAMGNTYPRVMTVPYLFNGATFDRQRGNYEEVALPSAIDTTGGRTSGDLVNYNAQGIALLVEVTAASGGGLIDELYVAAKVGAGYADIVTFAVGALMGARIYYLYPGASGSGAASLPCPRNFRVWTATVGTSVTYSVTVCYLN